MISLRSRLNARHHEAGVGLLSSSLGLVMLFGLLLLCLHTMLALQTRTLVNTAAWDAARAVAKPGAAQNYAAVANERVNNLVGKLEPQVQVSFGAETVTVQVSATSPGLLPGVTSLDSLRQVERSATVRLERPQE
jgi:hypothetical protein